MRDRVVDQLSLIIATAIAAVFASQALSGELVGVAHPGVGAAAGLCTLAALGLARVLRPL